MQVASCAWIGICVVVCGTKNRKEVFTHDR
nr:MAG TPA: hypothetical protein [Caudoviricetes sp.]